MKSILLAAILALPFMPGEVHAQAAPAADPELAVLQKMRGKLVGKWINILGEVISFTDSSVITYTSATMQADPTKPKELKGTFVLTANLQLQVNFNGKPVVQDFSVDSSLLRIKNSNGEYSEYQRYDLKNLADLTRRELEILDSSMDQWAIENNKGVAGARPTVEELRKYIRKGLRLYYALNDPTGPKDILGNSYGELVIGKGPKLHPATARIIADTVPKSYWKHFVD
jgi:hypothetical protein